MQSMEEAGGGSTLHLSRAKKSIKLHDLCVAVPKLLSIVPFNLVSSFANRYCEHLYVNATKQWRDSDIAYLWPSVSLATHSRIADLGLRIVMEGINTRMKFAKPTLDEAYIKLGIEPNHGITEARIIEEEQKLSGASAIFAPSKIVEMCLSESAHSSLSVLPSSYGVDSESIVNTVKKQTPADPFTFLFVGYLSVRKGAHLLLEAWSSGRVKGRLAIAGNIEPCIAQRYAKVLNGANVDCLGFVKDVTPLYDEANVFVLPSLEEGDPLVTYEAAARGLPIIATRPGAGRLGDMKGNAWIVDTEESEDLAQAMQHLSASEDLRVEFATQSLERVRQYTWSRVGERRVRQLAAAFS